MNPVNPTLSRFMPSDWQKEVLSEIETLFNSASPQHEARKWEYSQALRATWYWGGGGAVLDVGGAGSPFANMLSQEGWKVEVVDPSAGTATIEDWKGQLVDAVFSISVLEHVEDQESFLRACIRVLKSNGLLFLTMDAAGEPGPDNYMFHWMRQRIYNPKSLLELSEFICSLGMEVMGPVDLTPSATPSIPDLGYSFASLAFTKL